MRADSGWKMIIQVEQGLRSLSLKARPKTTHAGIPDDRTGSYKLQQTCEDHLRRLWG